MIPDGRSSCDGTGVGGGVVGHSRSTAAAASASSVVGGSNWARNARFTVPDGVGWRARSTGSSDWISVGQVGGTVTGEGLIVPDSRGRAGDTLLGVGVVERSGGSALALGVVGIEGEAGWAAFALSS